MRGLWALVLVLALTACAPRLTATPERDGEEVTIILAAQAEGLYAVTLSVLNASTDDERCVVLGGVDIGCVIGDVRAGEPTLVSVTPSGEAPLACAAFGFLSADLATSSYRVFRCEGGGS